MPIANSKHAALLRLDVRHSDELKNSSHASKLKIASGGPAGLTKLDDLDDNIDAMRARMNQREHEVSDLRAENLNLKDKMSRVSKEMQAAFQRKIDENTLEMRPKERERLKLSHEIFKKEMGIKNDKEGSHSSPALAQRSKDEHSSGGQEKLKDEDKIQADDLGQARDQSLSQATARGISQTPQARGRVTALAQFRFGGSPATGNLNGTRDTASSGLTSGTSGAGVVTSRARSGAGGAGNTSASNAASSSRGSSRSSSSSNSGSNDVLSAGLLDYNGGSGYIASAKVILGAILRLMISQAGNNNPFANIAKLLAAKSMVEVAKSLTEAGMTDEVVNESPILRHEALLVDTQASGLRGIFETAIQYWNQAAQANKQIAKDAQQLAQRA